jgi:Ni,Fe-hydrogenase I small subunit
MATPQPATSQPSPSVIWLSGQACSGCPVSLLNRVVAGDGTKYYDADMLNAVYGSSLPTPTSLDVAGADPANHDSPWVNPLAVVNDAADLLVGDAVGALTGLQGSRSLLWADTAGAAIGLGLLPTNTLLAAYLGNFPTGYVTLDWNATVMAAAGDIPAGHLKSIRNGGGLLGVYVVVVDGAIPTKDKDFCWVFDNDDGNGGKVVHDSNIGGYHIIGQDEPVSVGEALEWLATGSGCLGVVSVGACASYGGIPGGNGNKTRAVGVQQFFNENSIGTAVINVPGCPPHPDWIVYPVAYILSHSTFSPLSLALPTLDADGRPRAVFSGSLDDGATFCTDCGNKPTQGKPTAAQELGEAGCLGGLGCKGPYTVGDCPIRGKNTSDDGVSMNWCVGASGPSGVPGTRVGAHIGEARHPCQGCIDPRFPDWGELAVNEGNNLNRTSKNIKGFYNP